MKKKRQQFSMHRNRHTEKALDFLQRLSEETRKSLVSIVVDLVEAEMERRLAE